MDPLDERVFGILAFEVVSRVEEILPAGLPLTACQCAKRIETAGDRADKTAFTPAVGRHWPKDRR